MPAPQLLLVVDISVTIMTLMELWSPTQAVAPHFLLALLVPPLASFGAPFSGLGAVVFQSPSWLRRVSQLGAARALCPAGREGISVTRTAL
jgi:hypothetical protein